MKKQLVSKIIFSYMLLTAIPFVASSSSDLETQILNVTKQVALKPLRQNATNNGLETLWTNKWNSFANGTSYTQTDWDNDKLSATSTSTSTSTGGTPPAPAPVATTPPTTPAADAAAAAAAAAAATSTGTTPTPPPAAGSTGGGAGGGAAAASSSSTAAAFPSAADIKTFAQCVRMAGELLVAHSGLGSDFITLTAVGNIETLTIDTDKVTAVIDTAARKSYSLGTLGKPAAKGKQSNKAMTASEKQRHADLVERKGKKHNPVMQAKKAPAKKSGRQATGEKASARGGKKQSGDAKPRGAKDHGRSAAHDGKGAGKVRAQANKVS